MNMDHAFLTVGFAFSTSHFAGMAANTALHVYEKAHLLVVFGYCHNKVDFVVYELW
jgi:hypothetical protein